MATKRKPYIREMDAGWWKKNPFYRFYMLREGTSIFQVLVSLEFIYCLAAPESFFTMLGNPLVIVLNIIALLAMLLHTKTWFELAPKAVNGSEKQTGMMVKALWGATIAASAIILLLAFTA